MTMTVAALKRTLVPGTRVHVENFRFPDISRDTVVLPETNTVDLVTHVVDKDGNDRKSHLPWPPAGAVVGNEDGTITILEWDTERLSYSKVRKFVIDPPRTFVTFTVLD